MKATLNCVCQSRMTVGDGKAVCHNGACKHFGVEFVAPDLQLQPVTVPSVVEEVAAAEPGAASAEEHVG